MSYRAIRGYLAIQRRALMLLEKEHGESQLLTTALESNSKILASLGPDPDAVIWEAARSNRFPRGELITAERLAKVMGFSPPE